ncbi:uncharacterized protein BO80DRAFT_18374, partial [Aspergillus ibericus CBS 121593]
TSPLLHLPPELRNKIYSYTLESLPSPTASTRTYRRRALYYRPGFQRPKRISTALLQTCQQIYAEASLLPALLTTHTFWCYRAPPHVRHAAAPGEYFARMTPEQRGVVREVGFFTQQFFLEGRWGEILRSLRDADGEGQLGKAGGGGGGGGGGVRPRKITLTLRHSDWWFWERNEELGIDPFRAGRVSARQMRSGSGQGQKGGQMDDRAWGNQFVNVPGLETLVVEFETVMRKRDQLDWIVQMAAGWRFPLVPEEGIFLVPGEEGGEREAWRWVGAREEVLRAETERGGVEEEEGEDGAGRVPELMPLREGGEDGKVELDYDPEVEEEYYVVFMTWRRQKVE